jgi:hypothetical protein
MILVNVPDVEEILVKDVQDYIDNDVNFRKIYPQFAFPNITQEHPFAVLTERITTGGDEVNSAEMFPCIAIMDLQQTWNPQEQVGTEIDSFRIGVDEIADINMHRDQYIVSDDNIKAMTDMVKKQEFVGGTGVSATWRSSITVEVWADQPKVKNVLFFLMQAYFLGPRRYDLRTKYGITPVLSNMSADKTGVYNFDFGMELWGSMIRVAMDYVFTTMQVDVDTAIINGVLHSNAEGDIHAKED